MTTPEFLAIGHVTIDLIGRRRAVGGAALYAALAASRLGMRAALLTSAAPAELSLLSRFPVAVAALPAACTTTFRNNYVDASRRQRLHARAEPLSADAIPAEWRSARIVYLAPVAGELEAELLQIFPDALRGVGIQGWLRGWDEHGNIHPTPLARGGAELEAASVAFVSTEDLGDNADLIARYASHTRCLIVTRADEGADMYRDGQKRSSPAYPANPADPTGAGDVFAAAFLVQLSRRGDDASAARFANCAASLTVERRGLAGVPMLDQVNVRLRQ